jgi:ElaB/YqjD/DUF883 family membrane-anchored ribosome-binding protein
VDDKIIKGGAGPALAAHSKDASALGTNPASVSTGENHTKSATDGISATVDRIASQAIDAAGKAAISIKKGADEAPEHVTEDGTGPDQVRAFVRKKPLPALLTAVGVGAALGLLISRR